MRILLDECIDQRFRRDLQGHYVDHVRRLGWASLDDGALLRRAAGAAFDAFVTVDRGFAFQQDLTAVPIAIIIFAREAEHANIASGLASSATGQAQRRQ